MTKREGSFIYDYIGRRAFVCSAIFLLFLMLFALLLPIRTKAAAYDSEYTSTIYNSENGLGISEINVVTQIESGYIWIGSYSGLYQYDGKEFEKLNIDSNIHSVMCLLPDGRNGIWIGTNDAGLIYYSFITEEVTQYTVANGLGSNSVRALCYDKSGNLYIGTNSHLSVLNENGIMTTYDGSEEIFYIRNLTCRADGTVAGVTNAGTVFLIQDGKIIKTLTSEKEGAIYSTVKYISDGSLLIADSDGVIYKGKINGSQLELKKYCDTGVGSSISCIIEDSEKDIIVAAESGFGYIRSTKHFNDLTREDFYSSIDCIYEDYQGNIWFASSKQGLLKLSKNPFTDIFAAVGADPAVVNCIACLGERMYCGTDNGLVIINTQNNKVTTNSILSCLEGARIRDIMVDSNKNIWFSTYGDCGLVKYDGGSVTLFNENESGTKGSRFRTTLELSDGTIVVASTTGISFIRDDVVVNTLGESDGLKVEQILCLMEGEDGEIYAGSDGDGIYVIKDGAVVDIIGNAQGLESLVVMRMVKYESGMFLVTANSLFYYDGEKATALSAFPYSNNYDICLDDAQNAWITSSAGLYMVKAEDLLNNGDYSVELLNKSRGFSGTLVANSWNYMTGYGDLYLCCGSGIMRFRTSQYEDVSDDFVLTVKQVLADGVELLPDEGGVYQIDSTFNRITFVPAVLNYKLSNPIIKMYLEGFEEEGIISTQSEMSEVSYTNLSAGNYTFHLQVLDRETGDVLDETQIIVHKSARFYESYWFWGVVTLAIIFVICVIIWAVLERNNSRIIKSQYDEIQHAKEEAERISEYKTQFLQNMSHEIRTPINTIMGMDELILRDQVSGQVRQYANDIYTASSSLLTLINDILDLSKIESGKMNLVSVEYSLGDVLKELGNALRMRADEAKLATIFEFDENIPDKLYGDDNRIKQIIMNLITNAVKYTREGSVTFRAELISQEEDLATIGIHVIDTGIGIKREDMGKLFAEFERLDEEKNRNITGTGLGMPITKQLLEMMGSKLLVDSVYGEGSDFHFVLSQKIVGEGTVGKLNLENSNSEEFESYKPTFQAPDVNILIVDDTPLNLAVIRGLLRSTKVNVDTGESGLVALERVKNKHYDLILMDHMMPEMDGIETLDQMQRINHKCKGVPVIVLTANAIAGAKDNYLKIGFTDYLSKPVSGRNLENMLLKYLPQSKIQKAQEESTSAEIRDVGYQGLHYINSEKGIGYCAGDKDLYEHVLNMFVKEASDESGALQRYKQERDSKNYVTHAHKLKSSGRTIGADLLFEKARELEMAGKSDDWNLIDRKQGEVIQLYLDVVEEIKTKILG